MHIKNKHVCDVLKGGMFSDFQIKENKGNNWEAIWCYYQNRPRSDSFAIFTNCLVTDNISLLMSLSYSEPTLNLSKLEFAKPHIIHVHKSLFL